MPHFRTYFEFIYNYYSPIKIFLKSDFGISAGTTINNYMRNFSRNTWQSRVRFERLKRGMSPDEVAKKIGMSRSSYLKKYENDCHHYYTSVENYVMVCEAIGIEYDDIADEYMRFIRSPYADKLKKAISKSGLNSKEFADKYGLEYTTLRHSLKSMHKPSVETFKKYSKIFDIFEI